MSNTKIVIRTKSSTGKFTNFTLSESSLVDMFQYQVYLSSCDYSHET